MQMKAERCVFLDRDGVINKELGDYTYKVKDFEILPGVIETCERLKEAGFKLVVITNQAGVARGRFTREDVNVCHDYFQKECGGLIDAFYFAPMHPTVTESLSRKPNSLMIERAMARFGVTSEGSWMIGDSERDILAGQKCGLSTVRIYEGAVSEPTVADYTANSLEEAAEKYILV